MCWICKSIEHFKLDAQFSETKAAGAGATGIETQLAKIMKFNWADGKIINFNLIVFDLSHVNETYSIQNQTR